MAEMGLIHQRGIDLGAMISTKLTKRARRLSAIRNHTGGSLAISAKSHLCATGSIAQMASGCGKTIDHMASGIIDLDIHFLS